MMEELVRIALLGTSNQAAAVASSEHPADALVAGLGEEDRDSAFLLRAGTRAVFSRCGQAAVAGIAPPAPSLPESQPPRLAQAGRCPANRHAGPPGRPARDRAPLRNAVPRDRQELLTEILEQMAAAGVVLPAELLPQALDISEPAIRERLLPVLGERGRWLSQFQTDWQWVTKGAAAVSSRDRQSLRRQWDEGSMDERSNAIATLRRSEPAEARAWVEQAIDREKPEHRIGLLKALEVGLEPQDEPFLESRLDDRSEQVRATAAALLARLPSSALAGRMQERHRVDAVRRKGGHPKKANIA